MWLFRHKYHVDGALSRYKALFVVNGSTQLEGIDNDETFSSVVKLDTIRTVLIYMHQPPGFRDSVNPDYVEQILFISYCLGSLNYFLGISVMRDSSGMFLSQRKCATEILERASMVSCNSSRTPVNTESKLGDDGDSVSDQTFVFICMILMSLISRHLSGFLRFIRGTLDYELQLFPPLLQIWLLIQMRIGLVALLLELNFLGNNLLSWSFKRHPKMYHSSAETEYRGVANAVAETFWLRNILHELHTPLSSATLIYCDNVSVVYLSSNPVQHQRTKYIEINIHFVRDLAAARQ
ncbi:ribonuclease H-like domain-containing protein, partial [Tanacetum coccineum]